MRHDRLFISDTGWNTYEEIDVGGPGANFGWPYYEGADGGRWLPRNNQYASTLPNSAAFYAAVDNGEGHDHGSVPRIRFIKHRCRAISSTWIVGGAGYLDGARYPDSLRKQLSIHQLRPRPHLLGRRKRPAGTFLPVD